MASNETITRWARYVALGEIERNAQVVIPYNGRVSWDWIDGERSGIVRPLTTSVQIYSYGRHFPLARFVPKTRKSPAIFILNGDRWGGGGRSATSRHQSEIRSAVADVIRDAARFGERIDSILIPFSALEGAGVDMDTIRPIHVREDRSETIQRSSRYLNDVPRWMRTRTEYDLRTFSVAALKRDGVPGSMNSAGFGRGSRFRPYVDLKGHRYLNPADGEIQSLSIHGIEGETRVRVTFPDRDYSNEGTGVWASYEVIGDENGNVTVRVPRIVPNVTPDENGVYRWEENRHWLGDSLFSAEVPRTDTLEIVTDSREVADASGGAIGYRTRRPGEYVIGREVKTYRTRYRFLSSFDYNEPAPLYFLAALPRDSRAETVEDAYRDLMPDSVAAAIAAGKDVIRQGDIFAVETNLTRDDVYARANRRARRSVGSGNGKVRPGEIGFGTPDPFRAARETVRIFGTAHTATEVAVTPDGVTYIRGRMYHDPDRFTGWGSNRRIARDHVTRNLGDRESWYIAIRNTVPRLRPNRTREIVRTADDIATETATV